MERASRIRTGPRGVLLCAIAIITTAAVLRLWRLQWGLSGPLGALGFPDEALVWGPYVRAFLPLRWSSFDQLSANYPTFYGYVAGLGAAAMHALGVIVQPVPRGRSLVAPETFIVARGVSALASIVTVAVVGLTAARMEVRRVGFAAAALMAVVPFEVVYAHVASPDTLLTTCAAVTVWFAYAAARGSGTSVIAAAGFAAGLASSTKYTGLALIVPVGWAAVENAVQRRSVRRGLTLAIVGAVAFGAGILVGCPPCVFHFDRVRDGFEVLFAVNSVFYGGFHNSFLSPTLGWYGKPYLYEIVASLPFVLGWPLYVLSIIGVVVAAWRRDVADRVIFAATVPYFVVMARSMLVFPRYLLPLLPGLVLLAARAVSAVPSRMLRIAVLAFVCLYSLVFGASQVARFSFEQQDQVAVWIADAARRTGHPGRVRVGFPKFVPGYFRLAAPLAAQKLTAVELEDGEWFANPPDFFVLPEWYEIAITRDMPDSPVARDLERLRSGAAGYVPGRRWSSWYLQRGFYTALDPAFAGDLWQGEIGFTVYARQNTGSS